MPEDLPQSSGSEQSPSFKSDYQDRTLTENLLRDSKDAIYFKDLESRFLRISRYLATRLGIEDPSDLIGKTDFDIFNYEHARDARNDELEIIASGEPKEGKLEREILPDGQTRWVLTSKLPLKNDGGEIVGTFGISRDITAQKEAEFALEESNKKLIEASRRAGMAEIAINILHNIGNVLNSVNVSSTSSLQFAESIKTQQLIKVADLLERNADNPDFLTKDERGKQLAPYIRKLGDQMSQNQERLIGELKSLNNHVGHIKEILKTQQSYAKTKDALEKFKLSEIIEDAVQINRDALVRHSIKLQTDLLDNPEMHNDKHRMLQILVNLIRNAKYACDEDPKPEKLIIVSTKRSATNEVDILVTDNGIGIPKENFNSLFNHGFTTREDGNGYGLHSCANLASEMKGRILVDSEGLTRGATFTLRVPITREASKSA
ncbi:MAG: ATP-binding protein [Opitutales bacterium]